MKKALLQVIRENRFYKNKAGQMLVIFVFTWMIFAGGLFTVFNVGTLVGERIRIQNAVDSAAFTGAVWEARCLNYIAYTNRTIVSELSFLCYLSALCSCLDAWHDICLAVETAVSAIPGINALTPIFSAIRIVIELIQNMLDMFLDLPWYLLPQGVGLLQTAMEYFIELKMLSAMKAVGKGMDPGIVINGVTISGSGINVTPHAVNLLNHINIRKTGTGDGLLKVLDDTLSSYTKGNFNGSLPVYNRSCWWNFTVIPLILKFSVGVKGDYDLSKEKIKTSDGPGVSIKMGYIDVTDLGDVHKWKTVFSVALGAWSKEVTLNMDDIRYYVFNQDKNKNVGIYAIAHKSPNNISSLVYQNLNGLFGAKEEYLMTMAKARAVYVDPVSGSRRHTLLKGADLEPNLFNPFWKAELVGLKGNDDDDYSPTTSDTMIKGVMKGMSNWLVDSAIELNRH